MTEYKYTPLRSLKMSESGPGTIEGHRAIFDIDEGADLILPGAFKDTLAEYLESGFSAHSHQWAFSEAIGFPIEARETERGFWVKSQFHSTDDAQLIRTKAKERMKAGKTVGFSFGYSVQDSDVIRSHEYERELPRLVPSHRLEYNLRQAKRFPQIRLLRKLAVIEDSIVTAPMNKLAVASGVKCAACSGVSRRTIALSDEAETLRLRSESLRIRAGVTLSLAGYVSTDSLRAQRARVELYRARYQRMLRG